MTNAQGEQRGATQDRALYGLAVFIACYGLLRLLMGSSGGGGVMRALHGAPALIACAAVAVLAPMRIWKATAPVPADQAVMHRARALLLYGGLFLAAAGVLVSSQFRTEGIVLLTEGQAFEGRKEEYILRSHYQAPFAGNLDIALTLESVMNMYPERSIDRNAMRTVLRYRKGAGSEQGTLIIRSVLPSYLGGTFFRVQDIGYSPSYSVHTAEGMVLDSAFVMLKVHPPGAEDSFRTFDLPHTIYVKYYPAGIGPAAGVSTGEAEKEGPAFVVRIARNYDLLIEKKIVRPDEPIDLGPIPANVALSFHEVRKWAKIHIVRDPGLPLAGAGVLAILVASGVAGAARIRRPGGLWK